jgi:hypothetical protein
VDDVEMDLEEIEWGDVEWVYLAQDKDQWRYPMKTVIKLQVP